MPPNVLVQLPPKRRAPPKKPRADAVDPEIYALALFLVLDVGVSGRVVAEKLGCGLTDAKLKQAAYRARKKRAELEKEAGSAYTTVKESRARAANLYREREAEKRFQTLWFGSGTAEDSEDELLVLQGVFLAAKASVNVYVDAFTCATMAGILIQLSSRARDPVRVRVIIAAENEHAQDSQVQHLKDAGIAVRLSRVAHALNFATRDGHVVITGSYSWSIGVHEEGDKGHILVTDQASLSTEFDGVFDADFDAIEEDEALLRRQQKRARRAMHLGSA